MTLLSPPDLDAAIRRGLAYLRASQRTSGEWPTLRSPALDLGGGTEYPCSVYASTFVVHHLVALADRYEVGDMVERAADFLRGERDGRGLWNYEGRAGTRLYPDLDDTACALAALQRAGDRPPDLSFYAHLWASEAAPGGPFYTWVGVADRSSPVGGDVDPLVNANLVFCCGLLGVDLPGAASELRRRVLIGDYSSRYCISPHFLIYAIVRAHADGGAQGLAAVMATLQAYVLEHLARPDEEPSGFNLACLAYALLAMDTAPDRVAPYLTALLAQQRPDGGFPGWGAYASFHGWYDGAPALTTALALGALDAARKNIRKI